MSKYKTDVINISESVFVPVDITIKKTIVPNPVLFRIGTIFFVRNLGSSHRNCPNIHTLYFSCVGVVRIRCMGRSSFISSHPALPAPLLCQYSTKFISIFAQKTLIVKLKFPFVSFYMFSTVCTIIKHHIFS